MADANSLTGKDLDNALKDAGQDPSDYNTVSEKRQALRDQSADNAPDQTPADANADPAAPDQPVSNDDEAARDSIVLEDQEAALRKANASGDPEAVAAATAAYNDARAEAYKQQQQQD